jgi:hypothetical protein
MHLPKNMYLPAKYVMPTVIWVASVLLFWAFITGFGCEGFETTCWKRWDSFLYFEIAETGYTLFPCLDIEGGWCGNAGWAPLYAWLVKAFSWIGGLRLETAGLMVTNVCFLGCLILAAKLLPVKDYTAKNWLLLAQFALFPGCVYFHALFPVSLTVFAFLAVYFSLKSERYWLAGIGASIGLLSYSAGMFILFPLFAFGISLFIKEKQWKPLLKSFLPVMAALIALFTFFWLETGKWNAMFLVQAKYGHGLYAPWQMLDVHFQKAVQHFGSPVGIIELQALFVLVLASYLLFENFRQLKVNGNQPLLVFLTVYLVFFWFLPFSMGENISLYRTSLFLCLPFILNRQNAIFAVALILVFVFFAFRMTGYFFDKTLI